MIKFEIYNGERVVNSIVLYKKMKMNPTNYSRWIHKNAPFGIEGKDYFPVRLSHNGAHREYLFSLEFARTLCTVCKTEAAKKLRFFLLGL